MGRGEGAGAPRVRWACGGHVKGMGWTRWAARATAGGSRAGCRVGCRAGARPAEAKLQLEEVCEESVPEDAEHGEEED